MVKISKTNKKIDYRGEPSPRGRSIVIATEGRVTEKQYFDILRHTNVRLVVLPTGEDNCSSPKHVIERLNQYKKEFELKGNDELWLMVDVDQWKCLHDVADEALRKKYKLAISNPCFEVWLLCHHGSLPKDGSPCKEVKKELKKSLGGSYKSTNLVPENYQGHVDRAIKKAQDSDPSPDEPWPVCIGTHVYKVVQSIRAS